jgi:hypothetical protein
MQDLQQAYSGQSTVSAVMLERNPPNAPITLLENERLKISDIRFCRTRITQFIDTICNDLV